MRAGQIKPKGDSENLSGKEGPLAPALLVRPISDPRSSAEIRGLFSGRGADGNSR